MNGLLERLMAPRVAALAPPRALSVIQPGLGSSVGGGFQSMAHGAYERNPTVNAAIELLAQSAAEPKIMGLRRRRAKPQIRAQAAMLRAQGFSNRAGAMVVQSLLIQNSYLEEVPDHPLVKMLNRPNPYMSGDDLWSTVVMDRYLAGNAYVLKARGDLGNVGELWRLRPDRVRVVPSREQFIGGYEYRVGNETVTYPAEDVMHFRTRNPLDVYYGMPPLLPILGLIDIDNYMKVFLKSFFENGGSGPGSILTLKTGISNEAKEEIRDRKRRIFGGPAGAHEMLILDNTESTYTQLGLDRGLRDALPKEIAAMVAAEISMIFGIPGSILGQLIGYESSSYANKRQDWQVLWDVTLTPLMNSIEGVLNRSMLNPEAPEFGGIDEVCFDLSDIRALAADEDAMQERARKNVAAGLWSFEEGRRCTGMDPNPTEGTFLIPSNMVATPIERLGEEPEPAVPPAVPGEDDPAMVVASAMREAFTPKVGRPKLAHDAAARDLWERGEQLRANYPGMTNEQVASRIGVSLATFKRYRAEFSR